MPGVSVIVPGTPGMRSAVTAQPRVIFRQAELMGGLAQGRLIDGANARDTSNTGDTDRLQAGCVMGKIAASGLYANSFFGVTLGTSSANGTAYTSGGTSICVSPAAATEIVRRIGQSGHLIWVGPPSAAGTVAALGATAGDLPTGTGIAFSAVNTTSGVITTSTLGANLVIGSLCVPVDSSGVPLTFIPDGWPIAVTDAQGANLTVQFPDVPVAGIVDPSQFIYWPADTSTRTWLETYLNKVGKYVFSDAF